MSSTSAIVNVRLIVACAFAFLSWLAIPLMLLLADDGYHPVVVVASGLFLWFSARSSSQRAARLAIQAAEDAATAELMKAFGISPNQQGHGKCASTPCCDRGCGGNSEESTR